MSATNALETQSNYARQLRERVQSLVKTTSQSELARKTGTTAVSVNRYLRGTRIPAEFCSALIESMGLNPAWLMLGEGTPYLADVSEHAGHMAGTLLELIQAMSAVAKLKLGSLGGKRQALVLRELNDALGTYERLRQKADTQTRGLFRELLSSLDQALQKFQMSRARDIFEVVRQVARLCNDEALQEEFVRHETKLAFLQGNRERAGELLRAAIRKPLSVGELIDRKSSQEVLRLCATLNESGKRLEAKRICEAALALCTEKAKAWPEVAMLGFYYGNLLCEAGELNRGIALMQEHIGAAGEGRAPATRAQLMRALLISGLLSVREAVGFDCHASQKGAFLATHASFTEARADLKVACDYLNALGTQEVYDTFPAVRHVHTVQGLVEAPSRKRLLACVRQIETWRTRFGSPPLMDVFEAQAHRLAGNKANALNLVLAVQKALREQPPDGPLDLLGTAMHCRNLLELVPAEDLTAAPAHWFFQRYCSGGALAFKPFCTAPHLRAQTPNA